MIRCRNESNSRIINRNVYRPHLAASSPGLPACLNYRRRNELTGFLYESDNRSQDQLNNRRSSVYSISHSNPSNLPNTHRNSLSSFYANSIYLSDDSNNNNNNNNNNIAVATDLHSIAFQLVGPPSYDDAMRVGNIPPFCGNMSRTNRQLRRQASRTTRQQEIIAYLPPPPAYTEIVTIAPTEALPATSSNNLESSVSETSSALSSQMPSPVLNQSTSSSSDSAIVFPLPSSNAKYETFFYFISVNNDWF